MQRRVGGLGIVALGAALAAAAWAAPAKPEGPSKAAASSRPARADSLERHFKQAEADFLKGRRPAAAAELQEAAKMLRGLAARLPEDHQPALRDCAGELEQMGRDLAGPKARRVTRAQLREAFARAHYALAASHQRTASGFWAKKELAAVGGNLQAAAHHLMRAAAWEGHKLEPARATAAREANVIGRRLKKGTAVAASKVGPVIKRLGEEIEAYGRKLEK